MGGKGDSNWMCLNVPQPAPETTLVNLTKWKRLPSMVFLQEWTRPNPRFEVEVERGERGCGAGCVACQSPGDACKVGPMWCGGVNNAMQTPNCTKVVLFVLLSRWDFFCQVDHLEFDDNVNNTKNWPSQQAQSIFFCPQDTKVERREGWWERENERISVQGEQFQ